MAGQQDYLPSFKHGFARSAAESRLPWLWEQLAGAWCPFLGVQGGLLFDLARKTAPASLNNSSWSAGPDGVVASFNGTSGYVNCGSGLMLDPSKPWSILTTIRCNRFESIAGVNPRILTSRTDADNAIQIVADTNVSSVNTFTLAV